MLQCFLEKQIILNGVKDLHSCVGTIDDMIDYTTDIDPYCSWHYTIVLWYLLKTKAPDPFNFYLNQRLLTPLTTLFVLGITLLYYGIR